MIVSINLMLAFVAYNKHNRKSASCPHPKPAIWAGGAEYQVVFSNILTEVIILKCFAYDFFRWSRLCTSCLLLAVLFILSGCSSKASLDPDKPVTLNIWHVYGSQTRSPLNDSIAEFNATEGKQKGVIIKVISVTNSSAIDKPLLAAAAKEAGSVPLPDLFTAYPRILGSIDNKLLLPWNEYLDQSALSVYQKDFLQEGYSQDKLYMLPIAKSTELLFLNQTYWDRFAAANGITSAQLADYEALFKTAHQYYAWSGGRQMFQINDFYHYYLTNMASLGDSFIKDGKLNLESPVFQRIYRPMAAAAISGGLSIEDGYASDRWKTAEIISNVGSTAGILYLCDYVTHKNNTKEIISTSFSPTPVFSGGKRILLARGTGLFAVKSTDERKNIAAAVFAKWIAQKQHNLDFVTHAGYLPVNTDALAELLADKAKVENPKYRMLYTAVGTVYDKSSFLYLPQYKDNGRLQKQTEKSTKAVLAQARQSYQNGNTDLDALVEASYQELLKQLK